MFFLKLIDMLSLSLRRGNDGNRNRLGDEKRGQRFPPFDEDCKSGQASSRCIHLGDPFRSRTFSPTSLHDCFCVDAFQGFFTIADS